MKKIFIILAIVFVVGMFIYELIYIKQKKFKILESVGIDKSKIDYYTALYRKQYTETMATVADMKASDFCHRIKKETNTVKWVGVVNSVGATALCLIPYVGPILGAAAKAGGAIYTKSEMKRINKEVEGY